MVLTRFTPFLSHLSTDKSRRVSHVFMSGQLSILFSIISLFCIYIYIYICLIIHFDFSEVYPATALGLGNNNYFPFSMETSDVISSCTVVLFMIQRINRCIYLDLCCLGMTCWWSKQARYGGGSSLHISSYIWYIWPGLKSGTACCLWIAVQTQVKMFPDSINSWLFACF